MSDLDETNRNLRDANVRLREIHVELEALKRESWEANRRLRSIDGGLCLILFLLILWFCAWLFGGYLADGFAWVFERISQKLQS